MGVLSNVVFKSHLEDEEKIIYIAHRHAFHEWKNFIKVLFVGLFLPILFYKLLPVTPFIYLWCIWLGAGIIKLFYEFADWYLDAWLITNLSVIDVKWNGFFDKSSTRIEYGGMGGITYNIKGFWGTILNFGDITIDHFLSSEKFLFPNVARPKKVEREILIAQEIFVDKKTLSDHEALKKMIVEMALREKARK